MASSDRAADARLPLQIGLLAAARFILSTGFRMVYPFLPVIARGLGVDVELMGLAITARSSLGLAAPAFGSLADRYGRRASILGSLALFAAGVLVVWVWPTYPVLIVSLLLTGAAKITIDAATQAYVGDRVPYTWRGRAIAITELGWSTAFLLGVPVAGWLIARGHWTAPLPWLALLALGAAVVLSRVIQNDAPHPSERPNLMAGLRLVLAHRSAMAALGVALLIGGANELVNIVFGVWLEGTFGLQVAALGLASTVIGVSELSGEGLVATLTDRLGMKRAVALGLVACIVSSVALPMLGRTLPGALVGLFLFYISFEFAYVSFVSLLTELRPGARATLMAGNIAAVSLGRVGGALLGPVLFRAGLLANGGASAAANVLAILLLVVFVRLGEE